jgi:putative transcriptional regulator
MQNLKGSFVKATSLLDDSLFKDALVLIIEHNKQGATGFIINKPFHRKFNELEEFRHSPALPMYYGGPVNEEGLYFLHCCADAIPDSEKIGVGIYYAGNFSQAVKAINNNSINSNQIKLLIGYCGWDAGQLEMEIKEGSWIIAPIEIKLFAD